MWNNDVLHLSLVIIKYTCLCGTQKTTDVYMCVFLLCNDLESYLLDSVDGRGQGTLAYAHESRKKYFFNYHILAAS